MESTVTLTFLLLLILALEGREQGHADTEATWWELINTQGFEGPVLFPWAGKRDRCCWPWSQGAGKTAGRGENTKGKRTSWCQQPVNSVWFERQSLWEWELNIWAILQTLCMCAITYEYIWVHSWIIPYEHGRGWHCWNVVRGVATSSEISQDRCTAVDKW